MSSQEQALSKLQLLNQEKLVSSSLLNLSAAFLEMARACSIQPATTMQSTTPSSPGPSLTPDAANLYRTALLCAVAAEAVDSSAVKAHFRAAAALHALSLHEAAHWACTQAAAISKTAEVVKLLADITAALPTSASGSRTQSSTALSGDECTASNTLSGAHSAFLQAVSSLGLEAVLMWRRVHEATDGGEVDAFLSGQKHKKQGNDLFHEGNFQSAAQHYLLALATLRLPASELLATIATCNLSMECRPATDMLAKAVSNAVGSLALYPGLAECHYVRASALMQLGLVDSARSACEVGLQLAPGNQILEELHQRLRAQAMACTVDQPSPCAAVSGSTIGEKDSRHDGRVSGQAKNQRSEIKKASENKMAAEKTSNASTSNSGDVRHPNSSSSGNGSQNRSIIEVLRSENRHLEELAELNRRMAGLSLEQMKRAGYVQGFDHTIPPFHTEFCQLGKWPAECDKPLCERFLLSAYECARGTYTHELSIINGVEHYSSFEKWLKYYQPEITARLGACTDDRFEWWLKAGLGDVKFFEKFPYNSRLFHSFTNSGQRSDVLTLGTTHVAVGFLDLGSLSAANLRPVPASFAVGTLGGGSQPLRWVGYDSSAYAVAKALVVAQMMRQAEKVGHIVQVWYSSTWSTAALAAFRSAVSAVLASPSTSSQTPEVLALLEHWQASREVSLKEARTHWLESLHKAWNNISNFVVKKDRMALCSYILTGELVAGQVGSTLMFSVPEQYGTRDHDELFLDALPWDVLMKERLAGDKDIVSTGVELLQGRVARLREHLINGTVTVELNHAAVDPSAPSVLSAIRALNPWTMSWSNVCDYYHPSDFHTMARACSSPDTIHLLYSMNWPHDVNGACTLDFMLISNPRGKEIRKEKLRRGRELVCHLYRELGFESVLHKPPRDNPMNLVDYFAAAMTYEAWVGAFFQHAQLKSMSQVAKVEVEVYGVLSHCNAVLRMTYTFDPDMTFSQV